MERLPKINISGWATAATIHTCIWQMYTDDKKFSAMDTMRHGSKRLRTSQLRQRPNHLKSRDSKSFFVLICFCVVIEEAKQKCEKFCAEKWKTMPNHLTQVDPLVLYFSIFIFIFIFFLFIFFLIFSFHSIYIKVKYAIMIFIIILHVSLQ